MNEPNRDSTPNAPTSPQGHGLARRLIPKVLFAGVGLATLAVLFLTFERRRSVSAQLNPAVPPAEAERAEAEKIVPPPIPDDQNFAATPFFASLFDKSIDVGASQWPDDFSRADQWPRSIPTLAESVDGRVTGRLPTDLVAWKKAFENAFNVAEPAENAEKITVSDRPDLMANAQAARAVLENLKPYEPALVELHAASKRPYARFYVRYDWENPWGILLPQLAVIKRTCQLLRLKSSAELAAGNSEQALQDVLLMLRLIDAPKDEPMLISQLVRVAGLEIAFHPIWEGLATQRWSESQLAALQSALGQFDFIRDLRRCLEAERTWGKLTIALLRDKKLPSLATLMAEDGKVEDWIKEADRAFKTAPREWFDAEQRNFIQLTNERLLTGFDVAAKRVQPRIVEENAHALSQALRKKENLLKDHLVFAKAFLIAPSKIHLKLCGTQGYADLVIVACALERHRLATGKFPEQLAALSPRFLAKIPHDIVSGEPLRYQLLPSGQFVLYSVGWNESDDGGELAFFASGRGPEKKEGDWVWRYPAPKEAASK